jgi:hypothetical protein
MVAMLGVLLWLAGCDAAASVSSGSPSTESTPTRATPDRSTAPASPSPPDDLGKPTTPPTRGGGVTVTLAASAYALRTAITATVVNGTDHPVYSHDSKTDCSILLLEVLDSGNWRGIPACAQMRPPATVAIGPSRSRTVTINPASSDFQVGMVLQPGTYRLKYTYRLTPGPDGDETLTALSVAFKIG